MAFITVDGENQIALKQGNAQLLNIDSFVLANIAGLGAEPADRIEAMPAPGDIVADLPVTKSGYVNTNQVVYSLVMDSTTGPFDFNWVGLVDAEDVLIAVVYVPLTSKTVTAGPVPGNNLTRNFLIAYSDIQATTAIAVPAETWQIDFTARLLGIDERERLSNFDIYGQGAFFANGWQVVRQGATTTYDVLPGIGYVGGIRADNAATQQIVTASAAGVWLDVSLEGDISNVSAVVAIVVDPAPQTDYTDGNGFAHYLVQIADIDGSGEVTDLRTLHEYLPRRRLSEHDDIDLITSPGFYDWTNDLPVNAPGGRLAMMVQLTNQPQQFAWGGLNDQLLMRRRNSGTWGPWTRYQTVLAELNEYPEIQTPTRTLAITAGSGEVVVDAGQSFVHRAQTEYSTDDYDLASRTFATDASTTYHLRWSLSGGFELKDIADAGYNPTALAEENVAFDTSYDDMLVARVATDGANTATITPLANARRLASSMVGSSHATESTAWATLTGASLTLNWGRMPLRVAVVLSGIKSNSASFGLPSVGTAAILQLAVRAQPGGTRYTQSVEYIYEDIDGNGGYLGYEISAEA